MEDEHGADQSQFALGHSPYYRPPILQNDPERLRLLAQGYNSINLVFLLSLVLAAFPIALLITRPSFEIPFFGLKGLSLDVASACLVSFVITLVAFLPFHKIGKALGWSTAVVAFISILTGLATGFFCAGAIALMAVQHLAGKRLRSTGWRWDFSVSRWRKWKKGSRSSKRLPFLATRHSERAPVVYDYMPADPQRYAPYYRPGMPLPYPQERLDPDKLLALGDGYFGLYISMAINFVMSYLLSGFMMVAMHSSGDVMFVGLMFSFLFQGGIGYLTSLPHTKKLMRAMPGLNSMPGFFL